MIRQADTPFYKIVVVSVLIFFINNLHAQNDSIKAGTLTTDPGQRYNGQCILQTFDKGPVEDFVIASYRHFI